MIKTRCPACSTAFRVTAEQLKTRTGKVRCGRCQQVFNALDTLIPNFAEQPSPVPAVATIDDTPAIEITEIAADAQQIAGENKKLDEESKSVKLTDHTDTAAASPALAELITPEGSQTAVAIAVVDAPTPSEQDTAPTGTTEASSELSDSTLQPLSHSSLLEEESPSPHRWPWLLGVGIALIALLIQITLYFRVELSVLQPDAKPALEAVCGLFDCVVELPSKADLIGIDVSDLHPDPKAPGKLQLTATLKNRAPFAQAYPHLELTLTDMSDKALMRKIIEPAAYLSGNQPLSAGFSANSDLPVQLALDPGGQSAVGYRLYLFYP